MNNSFLLGQMFRVPPITRWMTLLIASVALLVYIDALSPYSLYYSPLFLRKFEVWRVFTTFLYFGRPTLDMFMHVVFLYRYSKMLEEGCVCTSEYFWLILVISSALFVISNIYGISALGTSFSATITYIWTKRNPRAIVQIFGFISFPAFYLPFILPGFMLLSRRSISIDDVLGIAVGHLFHYFKDVYPRWGRDVLNTPCWVKKLFKEHPAGCCKSMKGTTIGEGRARYQRLGAQSNGENKARKSPEMDLKEAENFQGSNTGESVVQNESPQSHVESVMSVSSAHSHNPTAVSTLLSSMQPVDVSVSSEDPPRERAAAAKAHGESQSNDEWNEEWGMESSDGNIEE